MRRSAAILGLLVLAALAVWAVGRDRAPEVPRAEPPSDAVEPRSDEPEPAVGRASAGLPERVEPEEPAPERAGTGESEAEPVDEPSSTPDGTPRIAGRLVDADGSPWRRAPVRAQVTVFPWSAGGSSERFSTDPEGRFEMPVRAAVPNGGTRTVRFRTEDIVAELPLSQELTAAVTDVGDVVLDHGPRIVAGRVVDDRGEPVADATMHIQQHLPYRGRTQRSNVRCSGGQHPDGTFSFHAIRGDEPPSGSLELHVRQRGHLSETIGFRFGERDLVVTLQRAGGLAGSIALGPDQSASAFDVRLRSKTTRRNARVEADGTFELTGLGPGIVDVEVELRGAASPLVVEGLEVVPGEVRADPRLRGLRLFGDDILVIAVTVVDTAGEPIQRAVVEADGMAMQRTGRDGVATLHVRELPIDVGIQAFGYRPGELTGVRGDVEVTLGNGIEVELHCTARAVGNDPKYQLWLQLWTRSDDDVPRLVYGHAMPATATFLGDDGKLRIRLPGPGVYEVHPAVYVDNDGFGAGGSFHVDPYPTFTVLDVAGVQRFEIDVPQSAVDEMVRKLAR